MLQILLLITLISLSSEVHAKLSHLTCSAEPLHVFYVNGGDTKDPLDNIAVIDKLRALMDKPYQYDQKGLIFEDPIFNKYDGAVGEWFEKLYLTFSEYDLDYPAGENAASITPIAFIDPVYLIQKIPGLKTYITLARSWLSIIQGNGGFSANQSYAKLMTKINQALSVNSKALVITHGTGLHIFNKAYEQLMSGINRDKLGYVSGISLGMMASTLPPSPVTSPRFFHITNQEDQFLRSGNFVNVKPNVRALSDIDPTGHSALNFYLSDVDTQTSSGVMPMLYYVDLKIKDAVSGLLNSDETCCNKREGKLWENTFLCENENCLGGFVEKTTKISLDSDRNLYLGPESIICGSVSLSPTNNTMKIIDTKLYGPALITGEVEIKNVFLNASTSGSFFDKAKIVAGSGRVLMDFTGNSSENSTILGRPQIEGDVTITSNKTERVIEGSPEIRGKVTIENSKLKEQTSKEAKQEKVGGIITIDAGNKEIHIKDSSLNGRVDIGLKATLDHVLQTGVAKIQNAILNKTTLYNNYYSTSTKPGLKIMNGTSCTEDITIGEVTLSGEVDIQACGEVYDSAALSGHVQLKGMVHIGGNLAGEAYDSSKQPMKLLGSDDEDHGIFVNEGATVYNRPTIEGDIVIDYGATIRNNGKYKGETSTEGSGETFSSHLDGGGDYIGDEQDFSGAYYIAKGLSNVKIVGEYEDFGGGLELKTSIYPNAKIEATASLKGPIAINGEIGAGVIVEGKNLGGAGGVYVTEDSKFTGAEKRLEGGVILDDTEVTNSNINGSLIDMYNQAIMHLDDHVTVKDSTLAGIGRITYSSLDNVTTSGNSFYLFHVTFNGGSISGDSGAVWSTLNNATIRDTASVSNSTLNGTTAEGNAILCNRTYGASTYGAGYNCANPKRSIEMLSKEKTWILMAREAQRISREAYRRHLAKNKKVSKRN